MQIYTSRYHNKTVASGDFTPVGISQGNARFLKYTPVYLRALAPTRAMIKMTDKVAYQEAYVKILDDLGIANIQKMLAEASGGKPIALLCFEDLRKSELWCHRTMFAEWYEQQTGQKVEELQEQENNKSRVKPQLALF